MLTTDFTNLEIILQVFEIFYHSSHKAARFVNANHDQVLNHDHYNDHNADANKIRQVHVIKPTPNNVNIHVAHVNIFAETESKYFMYYFYHLRHHQVEWYNDFQI